MEIVLADVVSVTISSFAPQAFSMYEASSSAAKASLSDASAGFTMMYPAMSFPAILMPERFGASAVVTASPFCVVSVPVSV